MFQRVIAVRITYGWYCMSATFYTDKLVTFLVNQEFTIDAFISLAPQSPYPVCANGTVSSLKNKYRS